MAKKAKSNVTKIDVSEMTYESDIAERILKEAVEQVGSKAKLHGDTVLSFTMIGELWTVYVKHCSIARTHMTIQPDDVAQLMAMLKIARSVYGAPGDNYVDEAGYSSLAAMLRQEGEH